jgi:hypothetical protein
MQSNLLFNALDSILRQQQIVRNRNFCLFMSFIVHINLNIKGSLINSYIL